MINGSSRKVLTSRRLILRQVLDSDLSQSYVDWLNDPSVNRYLETRYFTQSYESILSYWKEHVDKESEPWFAICRKESGCHIGNIKVGPINSRHAIADVSIFIGDRDSWGLGLATEAIKLTTAWCFDELKLGKLTACLYEDNISSRRAFEKAGYIQEAILLEEAIFNENRVNTLRMSARSRIWRR